jgi:hypothetical protein
LSLDFNSFFIGAGVVVVLELFGVGIYNAVKVYRDYRRKSKERDNRPPIIDDIRKHQGWFKDHMLHADDYDGWIKDHQTSEGDLNKINDIKRRVFDPSNLKNRFSNSTSRSKE